MDMDFNIIAVLLKYIIILTYGFFCFISIIFTFFIEKYQWLNDILEYEVIPQRVFTTIESNFFNIDDWLLAHHRTVGPILFFASAFNAYALSNTIQHL